MLRVFVVEDDAIMQSFITEILKEEGYEIVGLYDTGEDAVLAISDSKPDIVLMDIELAGYLDGVEAAERIRESYQCPIIFMSGLSDQKTLERTKLNETFAYLIKPFKPRELFINIEMAMYKYLTDLEMKKKQLSLITILKSLGEGLIVTDSKGIINIINPLAEGMLGKSSTQCLNKDINEIFKINDVGTQQFLQVFKDLKKWPLKHNEIYEVATDLSIADDKTLPIYLNLNCLYNKDEQIEGYVFVFKDLSQQKKNQSMIERLSAAVRNNPVGVMIINKDFIIEYINPKFRELTGYIDDDLLNQDFSILYENIEDSSFVKNIKDRVQAGHEWKSEVKTLRKDGTEFWEYLIISPIYEETDLISSYIFIVEDITQSKLFSEQIQLSEKKYKDLFEHSPVALWYINFQEVSDYLNMLKEVGVNDLFEYFQLNPNHLNDCIEKIEVLDVNQSALNLVEWKDKSDLKGKYLELFKTKDNSFFLDIFNSIYHRQIYKQEEISLKINEKITKILQIKWLISLDNSNDFKNVLISTIDITEKIMTNEMLKKQTYDLKERVKEQSTLFRIHSLLSQRDTELDDLLISIVTEMQAGFQQPGFTSVKIVLYDKAYNSPLFKSSEHFYKQDIYFHTEQIGLIQVYLTNNSTINSFLSEEINLIDIIAKQISNYLEYNYQKNVIEKKLNLERTISKISTRFLSTSDFEENINLSLQEIGEVTSCDRTYIFVYSDDYKIMDNRYEWCNTGIDSQINNLKGLPSESLQWWHENIVKGNLVVINDIDKMPEKAKVEQAVLREQNVKSLIAIPFYIKEKIRGFVGFDNCSRVNAWDENDQALLMLFTQLLGNTWERKLTSEQLLNEHNFSIQIINSVSVLIMVIKPDGRIVHFNRFCEVISGYKKHEMKDMTDLRRLLLPEEEDSFIKYFNNLNNGYEQDSLEVIWRSKDKKIRIVQWDANIIYNNDKIDYIIMNGTDITDIKRSEQLLIEREVQYRTLLQNLTIGIFRSTGYESGRFIQANKALADMLEYDTLNELLALNESEIYANPADRIEILKEAIKSGEIQKKEILLKKKTGTQIWAILNAKTIYDDYGNFKWIDGFVEDITEIRKLEQQLIQSQKMEAIGQLAAGIAHEINTPTQFVSDNLNFLKDSFASMLKVLTKFAEIYTPLSNQTMLDSINNLKKSMDYDFIISEVPLAIQQSQDGLDRISTIIRAMKDFSHPANEDLVTMEVNHMLESTLTVARNEWKYNCDVDVQLDPSNPIIQCYPGELNQAFLNIIVNAAQAIKEKVKNTNEKGKITISTKAQNDYVEVRITDTGVGISSENKDKLYNPFFTTKEPGKGTGQGLSLVHHSVVKKHKGAIDFESELGVGTTFILKLPL